MPFKQSFYGAVTLIFDLFLRPIVIHGLLEAPYGFSKTFAEGWKLRWTENNQRYNKYYNQLG